MRKLRLVVVIAVTAWIVRSFSFAADPTPTGAVPQVASKPVPLGPAAPTDAADEVDVISETIGTMSGAFLNQAYVSIGILGDAVGAEVYEVDEARELLEVHLGLADQVEKQLLALAASQELDAEDAAGVKQLARIATLIRRQGETLQAVWSGDEKKIEVWTQLREETAAEIEKFFGEDEESQK